MRYLLLSLVLAASACVDHRYFAPRENLNGSGPGGYPAAVYTFEGDEIDGELRTWSRGAHGDADPDDPQEYRVEVHVGFELENTGSVPLELTGVRSERDDLTLIKIEGEALAAPGTTARLESWFLAPGAQSASELSEFAIRYSVHSGDREVFTQVTPFSTWYRPGPRHYDPWLFGPPYGYWGFGLGWSWSCY